MRHLFFILAAGLCLLWAESSWASAAQAGMKKCSPPQKAPSIVVHIQVREPMVDHTLTRQQLKGFQVATISPYEDSKNVHVNGIMRGSISLETQSAIAWQYTTGGNDNCFWFDQIEVTLRLNPTIYIAREIPYSSCLYKEVMEHEYKHFQTDFHIAKDYQTILDTELARLTRDTGVVGPFTREAGSRPKKDLMKKLDQSIAGISERMKRDRLHRQALIDTREEYDRVAAACPEDIKRY